MVFVGADVAFHARLPCQWKRPSGARLWNAVLHTYIHIFLQDILCVTVISCRVWPLVKIAYPWKFGGGLPCCLPSGPLHEGV